MKKWRNLGMRLVVIFALCCGNFVSADTFGLFTYTNDGPFITITDYPTTATGSVVIPDTIEGKYVTTIGASAFSNCSGLTSITIPSGVTSIGSSAFYLCTSLASINLPPSLTSIEHSAFNSCSKLIGIFVPSAVTSIGNNVWYGCGSLTEIIVDPLNAFYSSREGVLFDKAQTTLIQCPGGKAGSFTILANVTIIRHLAFDSCRNLSGILVEPLNTMYSSRDDTLFNKAQTTLIQCPGGKSGIVTIPSGVKFIGDYAFHGCANLTNIIIPTSVTSIGLSAFQDCARLTEIILPTGVVHILNSLFKGCRSLTIITTSPNLRSIGIYSFQDCTSLTNINLRSQIFEIPKSSFQGCRSLTSISIPSSVRFIHTSAFRDCASLRNLIIPSGVNSIGDSAFRDSSKLETVIIESGVSDIGTSAFSGCVNLTNISIPPSMVRIGDSAFAACGKLTGLTIPSGVYSIDNLAFSGCNSLTSVFIPSSVDRIGNSAFRYCKNLTNITVDPLNANYSSIDGILYNKNQTTLFQCPGGKTGSVSIPVSVTSVLSYAFSSCGSLSSVAIPANVTSIGSETFFGCENLAEIMMDPLNTNFRSEDGLLFDKARTVLIQCPGGKAGSVTLPSSVISIGTSALRGCGSLMEITVDPLNANFSSADGILFDKTQATLIQCPGGKAGSVTIPSGVTTIVSFAFSGCVGLTNVTIPAGVTSIASSAFAGCVGLAEILIPASVVSIGSSVFDGCRALTSISIPPSVASIGSYALRSCNSMASITVDPSNIAFSSGDGILFNKDQSALIQCPGGKSGNITIPTGVKTIGDYAFYDCNGLTNVTFPSSVTGIGTFVFRESDNLVSAVFIGDAPTIWGTGWFASFGANSSGFAVYHFDGKGGFSSPSWMGYPVVNMGETSALPPWLVSNGFPHDTDISSDPNGDGVNFLMAYALALDPKQNLSGLIPRPAFVGNEMSLVFYAGSQGITYRVETSDNLKNWSDENMILSDPDANGYRTAWHPGNGSNRFMRLSVSN